jgi:hypothetical protein
MEATRRVYQTVSFESVFARIADKAMAEKLKREGRELSRRDSQLLRSSVWDRIEPYLAKDWISRALLSHLSNLTEDQIQNAFRWHRHKIIKKPGVLMKYRLRAKP